MGSQHPRLIIIIAIALRLLVEVFTYHILECKYVWGAEYYAVKQQHWDDACERIASTPQQP